MSEPIKTGDLCEVVAGLGRHKSPNLGLKVTVVSVQGQHSQHGMIVRCTGDNVRQLKDSGEYAITGWADFAVSWLKKVEPPPPKLEHKERELVLSDDRPWTHGGE